MDSIYDVPRDYLVTGFRQVRKGIVNNHIRCVVIADDVESALKAEIIRICKSNGIPYSFGESMKELGAKLDLEVGCSVCGESVIPKEAKIKSKRLS